MSKTETIEAMAKVLCREGGFNPDKVMCASLGAESAYLAWEEYVSEAEATYSVAYDAIRDEVLEEASGVCARVIKTHIAMAKDGTHPVANHAQRAVKDAVRLVQENIDAMKGPSK